MQGKRGLDKGWVKESAKGDWHVQGLAIFVLSCEVPGYHSNSLHLKFPFSLPLSPDASETLSQLWTSISYKCLNKSEYIQNNNVQVSLLAVVSIPTACLAAAGHAMGNQQ